MLKTTEEIREMIARKSFATAKQAIEERFAKTNFTSVQIDAVMNQYAYKKCNSSTGTEILTIALEILTDIAEVA